MGYVFSLQIQYIVDLINFKKMSWTPEKEKKLRELWKKGYSASQISSMIEGKTRNAVIGKAHRLKLEARSTSRKSEVKDHQPKKDSAL